MKKLIKTALFLAIFGIGQSFAQSVNDVPIQEIKVKYIRISGVSKMFSNKIVLNVDFGQENKAFKNTSVFKDAEGKNLTFMSIIDALNFFAENGYELDNAYSVLVANQGIDYYILKRVNDN